MIFLGSTEPHWVKTVRWVKMGYPTILLGFTGFYWVLLGFTGFQWVLMGSP